MDAAIRQSAFVPEPPRHLNTLTTINSKHCLVACNHIDKGREPLSVLPAAAEQRRLRSETAPSLAGSADADRTNDERFESYGTNAVSARSTAALARTGVCAVGRGSRAPAYACRRRWRRGVARPRGFRAYCGATESGSCDAEVYARAGHACTRPSRVPMRARACVCVHARAHVRVCLCACVMSYRWVQHLRHQPCKTLRMQPQKAQKAMRCEPAATAALADRQAWRALRAWVRCGHSAEAIGLPAGTLSCRVNETCLASIACSAMARGNSHG